MRYPFGESSWLLLRPIMQSIRSPMTAIEISKIAGLGLNTTKEALRFAAQQGLVREIYRRAPWSKHVGLRKLNIRPLYCARDVIIPEETDGR